MATSNSSNCKKYCNFQKTLFKLKNSYPKTKILKKIAWVKFKICKNKRIGLLYCTHFQVIEFVYF